jgi:sterol desaturase/sphingolipid hydroxylase (fatty acid hydroxylase superfamily)
MVDAITRLLAGAGHTLWLEGQILLLSATLFGGLAVILKGEEAFAAARRAAAEVRINLSLFVVDALFVGPVVAILVQAILGGVTRFDWVLVNPQHWASLGGVGTIVVVVFLSDLISYGRHRLEHTRWLWPAHAIHHSDTDMTWLTLTRFHPINRLTTTIVDMTCLALLGFPAWALVSAQMLQHYYGEFIHADVPWTYGPFRYVFVSPVMHRWHHARDVVGAGSNFATIFSVFDQTFGTFHVPGPCDVPLGVTDDMGRGVVGQLCYPLVAWGDQLRGLWRRKRTADAKLTSPPSLT